MHTPHLNTALRLAESALWRTSPNPRVGCVLVNAQGLVIGQGSTQAAGQAHAEVMALRDAQQQGHSITGATAYVTLEPCAHQGRTGPCCDALASAGIAHVISALPDPNPLVAGQGFARLRAAGVAVTVASEQSDPELKAWAAASRELNLGFFSRMLRKTPWVRLKAAASLDGITALPNGQSQWITGAAARADGHAWRARACALLTGIGTVLQDQPRLDVREVDTPRQPMLVIVDSDLQTPPDAALFAAQRKVLIYCANPQPVQQVVLEARGATIICMPGAPGADGTKPKVDLAAMLRDLAARGINELHVEAGHKLNGSLLRSGLVDEFLVYLSPKLIGQGADIANFGPLTDLSQALPLTFQSTAMVGPDLRIMARVTGRDAF